MHLRILKPIKDISVEQFEVIGQCSRCHDIFSVIVYRHGSSLYAVETASTNLVSTSRNEKVLIHRRGSCNGEVKLYGNEE
jgi:hypothetical protein